MRVSDFNALTSDDPQIKYGFTRRLLVVTAKHPRELLPFLPQISGMLRSPNSITKWTGTDVVGQLARVDTRGRIVRLRPRLQHLLTQHQLITANHAIVALGKLAQANPRLRKSIIKTLIQASRRSFETKECQRIVTGKVAEVLSDLVQTKDAVIVRPFVKRALRSSRPATRKKAATLAKKLRFA